MHQVTFISDVVLDLDTVLSMAKQGHAHINKYLLYYFNALTKNINSKF